MEEYLVKIEKNENYGKIIYQQIKQLIINGKLKAGSTINEREYADMLGVSRTPLREALSLLERDGWIEQLGKTRTVSSLLWKDILDLIELREPLDMIGFHLAVKKCTAADFAHLRSILAQMLDVVTQNDRDYYHVMKLDTSFHSYINHISGNSMLAQFSDKMNERITRTSVLSMKYSRRDGVFFVREHTEILDCMESGDLDGARTRLSAHYNSWKERMMQLPERIGFDPNEPNTKIYEEFIKIDK